MGTDSSRGEVTTGPWGVAAVILLQDEEIGAGFLWIARMQGRGELLVRRRGRVEI